MKLNDETRLKQFSHLSNRYQTLNWIKSTSIYINPWEHEIDEQITIDLEDQHLSSLSQEHTNASFPTGPTDR